MMPQTHLPCAPKDSMRPDTVPPRALAHHQLPIRSPQDVLRYLSTTLSGIDTGASLVLFLDRHHAPLGHHYWPTDGFHPVGPSVQQIFAEAFHQHAHALIIIQRHATQDHGAFRPTEDILEHASKCALTGQLLDVQLIDYLLVNHTHNQSLILNFHDTLYRYAREYAERHANPLATPVCLN